MNKQAWLKVYGLGWLKIARSITVFICLVLTFACEQNLRQVNGLPLAGTQDISGTIDLPVIKMSTVYGDIWLALNTKDAPISANNFLKYVDEQQFDGLGFYRNVSHMNDNHDLKISVLQGGVNAAFDDDFTPAFSPILHEPTSQTGLLHTRGSISMARGLPGTASTEFFISTLDNPHLNAGSLRFPDGLGFAVFGYVIRGMEVVDIIANLSSNKDHPDPYVKGQILDELVAIKITRIRNAKVLENSALNIKMSR